MTRYIAFLRAINVGGRSLTMETLRQLLDPLGFSEVATFIGSGNVIFETTAQDPRTLEREIEARLGEALGYEVPTFIRTVTELARIAAYEPFPASRLESTDLMEIIFLADELERLLQEQVEGLSTELDEYQVRGREIYWLRHRPPGAPAYTTAPLEKTLTRPFTIRGSKTVQKIVAKYGGLIK
jgi:uncharacterized protein (DUF1697 family)